MTVAWRNAVDHDVAGQCHTRRKRHVVAEDDILRHRGSDVDLTTESDLDFDTVRDGQLKSNVGGQFQWARWCARRCQPGLGG